MVLNLNTIYNMDCLTFMKRLPDNYFELILTDPPYGIGMTSDGFGGTQKTEKTEYVKVENWDKEIPSKEIFKEILRVSKNQIIFGGNYFVEYLYNSSCWIVWDKDNSDNGFADCELAWASFNKAIRRFKYKWHGMLQEHMGLYKEKRVHPTQKPIALGRWLLKKYAKEGDKIFDPFAGSGSFLLACKQLGFNYVGCEIQKEYCEIIEDRLKQTTINDTFKQQQQTLG